MENGPFELKMYFLLENGVGLPVSHVSYQRVCSIASSQTTWICFDLVIFSDSTQGKSPFLPPLW